MKTATFINTVINVCHETGENKTSKGPGKRVQHVGPTSSNMLDVKCWKRLRSMLDDVG